MIYGYTALFHVNSGWKGIKNKKFEKKRNFLVLSVVNGENIIIFFDIFTYLFTFLAQNISLVSVVR